MVHGHLSLVSDGICLCKTGRGWRNKQPCAAGCRAQSLLATKRAKTGGLNGGFAVAIISLGCQRLKSKGCSAPSRAGPPTMRRFFLHPLARCTRKAAHPSPNPAAAFISLSICIFAYRAIGIKWRCLLDPSSTVCCLATKSISLFSLLSMVLRSCTASVESLQQDMNYG